MRQHTRSWWRSPARLTAVAVAIGVTVTLLAIGSVDPSDGPPIPSLVGSPAPDIDLPTLDGGHINLADMGGRTLVVNFFNSWCLPCQREAPALAAFHADHEGDDAVVLVGVIHDDTVSNVRHWADARDVGWLLVDDPGARLALEFTILTQPETVVIGRTGTVVARHTGEATVGQLEELASLGTGGGS